MSKNTTNPKNRRRAKKHGFRARKRTNSGKNILNRRRRKGRTRVSVDAKKK